MADENTPWRIKVKEEKCLDNEIDLQPYLCSSFNSVYQLLITPNPSNISSLLTKEWLWTGQFTEYID